MIGTENHPAGGSSSTGRPSRFQRVAGRPGRGCVASGARADRGLDRESGPQFGCPDRLLLRRRTLCGAGGRVSPAPWASQHPRAVRRIRRVGTHRRADREPYGLGLIFGGVAKWEGPAPQALHELVRFQPPPPMPSATFGNFHPVPVFFHRCGRRQIAGASPGRNSRFGSGLPGWPESNSDERNPTWLFRRRIAPRAALCVLMAP